MLLTKAISVSFYEYEKHSLIYLDFFALVELKVICAYRKKITSSSHLALQPHANLVHLSLPMCFHQQLRSTAVSMGAEMSSTCELVGLEETKLWRLSGKVKRLDLPSVLR